MLQSSLTTMLVMQASYAVDIIYRWSNRSKDLLSSSKRYGRDLTARLADLEDIFIDLRCISKGG